ncbi:OHCU decarboxylase domain containing protein [Elaphomyces granulatus]
MTLHCYSRYAILYYHYRAPVRPLRGRCWFLLGKIISELANQLLPAIPTMASLAGLPVEKRLQLLDTLFEPSPELQSLMSAALTDQSFNSYEELIEDVGKRLSALSTSNSPDDGDFLKRISGSHPRLGESNPVAKADMSELSRREQANLNSGSGTQAEELAARLRALNWEYEATFPGLRYVTFVNRRARDAIMQEMRCRIDRGDMNCEINETIQAMCDIARDRANKLDLTKSIGC